MYGVVNALYWKNSKRQISIHLTVLKHQNTKTSLYELSRNHWVFELFEIFGSVRKKLQFTVFNDHPVVQGEAQTILSKHIFFTKRPKTISQRYKSMK